MAIGTGKVLAVLHLLARLWLGALLPPRARGFRHAAPPPASRPRGTLPRRPPPPRAASPRRHAFGGGGGGGGFGVPLPPRSAVAPPPPLLTRADVARRLGVILAGALRQCATGFANGYLLALAWGLVRGPSTVVDSRAVAWGLDFAVLPTVFSGTRNLSALALALPRKGGGGEEGAARRGRRVALWSAALRNMALGAYFGRQRGLVQIARSSALAGALTLYFVRKKLLRDAANPNRPSPAAMAQLLAKAMAGGGGAVPMPGAQPSPEVMAQVLAAMAANGGAPQSFAGGPRAPAPGPGAATRRPGAGAPASAAPRGGGDGGALRDGAVDVEFERSADGDDGDDAEDDPGDDYGAREGGRA